jgi:cytochrome c-type biogenesis protein CcmH
MIYRSSHLLRVAFLFLLAPLAALTVGAADGIPRLEPALEREAKEIENLLIAPCCWRQPVSDHYSPAADKVRVDVREKLEAGMGRQEIVQAYVAQYGNRILSRPPAQGFNYMAYIMPFVFLVAGAAVALVVIRRLRPGQPQAEQAPPPRTEIPPEYAKRLEKELQE